MTRFARAKGSKASNERHPEDPTPWHVMKQDIEMANASKKDNHDQQPKSTNELLKEKDNPYYSTATGNVNTDWAEFETQTEIKVKKEKTKHVEDSPKKENKDRKSAVVSVEGKENGITGAVENNESTPTPSKKAVKRESAEPISVEECGDKSSVSAEIVEPNHSKKKKKKNRRKKISPSSEIPDVSSSGNQNIDDQKTEEANEIVEKTDAPTTKLSKRQKRNRKHRIKTANDGDNAEAKSADQSTQGAFNTDGNDWSSDIKFGDSRKKDENTESMDSKQDQNENKNRQNDPRANGLRKADNKFNNQANQKKRKPPKVRDDNEHKRRKPNPGSTKIIVGGTEIETVMFDGFPMKREDAERLKHIRKQMVMKGIQKSEIDLAMKLERRKAEKALTRIKRAVCFHCRKAGHNLSDCPDLSKESSATGICFKCGSTEHTAFECKVNKKDEFRFASCFICREQGHIAVQCPDNPKGLYPDGGSCNACGSVTHLKKDCPHLVMTKEETTMTLSTISDGKLESLDEDKVIKSEDDCRKSKSKIVTF